MVNIAGNVVLAVLFEGNTIAASIRMICDLLGIDASRQMRKIRADRAIYDKLILTVVDTAGGLQETNVIIAEAIPIWLKGIYPNKVSPDAREMLIEFQRVAVQTLRAAFFPETKAQPQAPPPKQAPEPLLTSTPEQSQPSVYDLQRALVSRMEEEHLRLERRLDLLEHQQNVDVAWMAEERHQMQLQQEQTAALWSVVLGRVSAPEEALTADQQHTLHLLMRAYHQATGRPLAEIEREVLGLAGVSQLDFLQQGDWKPILAWFRQRLGW